MGYKIFHLAPSFVFDAKKEAVWNISPRCPRPSLKKLFLLHQSLRNKYGCDFLENGDFEEGTCIHILENNDLKRHECNISEYKPLLYLVFFMRYIDWEFYSLIFLVLEHYRKFCLFEENSASAYLKALAEIYEIRSLLCSSELITSARNTLITCRLIFPQRKTSHRSTMRKSVGVRKPPALTGRLRFCVALLQQLPPPPAECQCESDSCN